MVAITPTHRVSKRLILQMEREVGFLNYVDVMTREGLKPAGKCRC